MKSKKFAMESVRYLLITGSIVYFLYIALGIRLWVIPLNLVKIFVLIIMVNELGKYVSEKHFKVKI